MLRRRVFLCLALFAWACCSLQTAVLADAEDAVVIKQAKELAELRSSLQQKAVEANQLLKQMGALQGELAAAEAKAADAESRLSNAESKLSDAQSRLQEIQSELSSNKDVLQKTKRSLQKLESELVDVKAAAEKDSTCQQSLSQVRFQLSKHASRLAQLKTVEHALLPVWLSHRVDIAAAWAKQQWQHAQKSDLWHQTVEKLQPHWEQLKATTQPARAAAAEHLKKAQEALKQLPISQALGSVKQQIGIIESELRTVLQSFISSQPSLSGLNDPVTLQLLVYTVLGLPLLLLAVLLALLGGSKSSAAAADRAATKKSGTGRKGAASGRAKVSTAQAAAAPKGRKPV